MKNIFVSLILAGFLIAGITSCNNASTKSTSAQQVKNVKIVYTCPMHPEIIKDKPGSCPICGMTLVEKKEVNVDSMHTRQGDSLKIK